MNCGTTRRYGIGSLLIALLVTPVPADVMLQFQVDRPGSSLHGLTITTTGHGSFIWEDAVAAGYSNGWQLVAGGNAHWSTTVSGGVGAAARFNGDYVPQGALSNRQDQGVLLTATRTGALWLHEKSAFGLARGIQWTKEGGDQTLSYLGLSHVETLPVIGQEASFRTLTPAWSLLLMQDDSYFGVNQPGASAFEFWAVPRQHSTVPEPMVVLPMFVIAPCVWLWFRRRQRPL